MLRFSAFFMFLFALPVMGQKMHVTIVGRSDSSHAYHGTVPGQSTTDTRGSADCTAYGNTANCSATSTSSTTYMPPRAVEYSVAGSMLRLLLPDGRMVDVACESKYQLKFDYVNRRSCRVPTTTQAEANFSGKHVKLEWIVSLDGKKKNSETYNIEIIYPAPSAAKISENN